MKHDIILVTGGMKSGKSTWALEIGEKSASNRAFIATATAGDDEMKRKIIAHQSERGDRWNTFEEPRTVAQLLKDIEKDFKIVLIDCMTLWVSNLLTIYSLTEDAVIQEIDALMEALRESSTPVILISNEVGMGIMPADSLSRCYQRLLGSVNKKIAGIADSVYFMVAGISQKIK
jgi:adenosylcobinamide kinase/adenosylcobinamide-phosphate guanylyltransferase